MRGGVKTYIDEAAVERGLRLVVFWLSLMSAFHPKPPLACLPSDSDPPMQLANRGYKDWTLVNARSK